jgi:hypothetical protein
MIKHQTNYKTLKNKIRINEIFKKSIKWKFKTFNNSKKNKKKQI